MKTMNRKGMVVTWIWIVVTLFVVMLIYVILDQPLKDHLFPLARGSGVNNTTVDHITSTWDAMPFIFFLSLGLLGLMAALLTAR